MEIINKVFETDKYSVEYMQIGKFDENSIPLVIIHGGPGGSMKAYEPLLKIADKGFPIILYNQHGSGNSTIKTENHKDVFTLESYEEELSLFLTYLGYKKYHLLGHSWGGMLLMHYAIHMNTTNIKSLILFSGLPSTKLWNQQGQLLIKELNKKQRIAISKQYHNKEYNLDDYKDGVARFLLCHNKGLSKPEVINPWKSECTFSLEVYNYMWGNSECFGTGTLKSFNVISDLHKIKLPTLIISGAFDESTPTINKLINDKIKGSKWVLLSKSAHCGYITENKKVCKTLINWMNVSNNSK
jgi:proline iminopeptidase